MKNCRSITLCISKPRWCFSRLCFICNLLPAEWFHVQQLPFGFLFFALFCFKFWSDEHVVAYSSVLSPPQWLSNTVQYGALWHFFILLTCWDIQLLLLLREIALFQIKSSNTFKCYHCWYLGEVRGQPWGLIFKRISCLLACFLFWEECIYDIPLRLEFRKIINRLRP